MAFDLSTTPRSDIIVQASGDAHLSNFGLFASPERTLVFDSNDFDETLPGPWEWDVKRLAASVVIAARSNGFTPAEARTATLATVRGLSRRRWPATRGCACSTSGTTRRPRPTSRAELIEAGQDGTRGSRQGRAGRASTAIFAKARGKDQMKAMRLADGGRRRPVADRRRPAGRHPRRDRRAGSAALEKDVQRLSRDAGREPSRARRALSVRRLRAQGRRRRKRRHPLLRRPARGSRRGRSAAPPGQGGDRLGPATLPRDEPAHEPRRAGRRRPAADAGDARHLPRLDPRARRPGLLLPPAVGHEGLGRHRDACGRRGWGSTAACARRSLARAHARSGDAIAIAAYLGTSDTFDGAVADFAEAYADQNERDYAGVHGGDRRRAGSPPSPARNSPPAAPSQSRDTHPTARPADARLPSCPPRVRRLARPRHRRPSRHRSPHPARRSPGSWRASRA